MAKKESKKEVKQDRKVIVIKGRREYDVKKEK